MQPLIEVFALVLLRLLLRDASTICLWLCSFNEVSGCGRARCQLPKHTGVFAYLCLNNITVL